jgi:L-cysteine/cystine lyase
MVVETAKETKVDALRAQMPAVLETGYFNTGSYGPMPAVAFAAADDVLRTELHRGRIAPGAYEANRDRNRRLAALAADIFGAEGDEIALTHSASEGLNIALMGMTWAPGDEVVSTAEEHPGLLLPLSVLARRFGVVTRLVRVGNGGHHVVEAIAQQMTSRTRVIALSHVLWSTGAVLPLRDICDLAREREAMVIVDAAQSAGHVPVDLHAIGVDAYAMAGQKWLCGPEGTGFLYVRRDRFADIAPTFARYGQFDTSGFFMPDAGAKRFELGEFSAPTIAAQEAALRWIRDEVGIDWALSRIATLGGRFRRQIDEIDGVAVITPANAMAGLVNFNLMGMAPDRVTSELFARGYTIRSVDAKPCVISARASIGWWNTEEEVDGLVQAIAELASAAGDARE